MTEPKSDPENFNVQRSEFNVQRSSSAGRAVLFRLPAFAGTGLVAHVVGSELSYASQDADAARRIADALPPSLKSYGETRRAMPQR